MKRALYLLPLIPFTAAFLRAPETTTRPKLHLHSSDREFFVTQTNGTATMKESIAFPTGETISLGSSVPLSSKPVAGNQVVDSETVRKRNMGVALASILLALGNYVWQFTHPITPIQLLSAMQAESSPVTVIGNNNKPTIVDFWAPWCENCKFMAPTLLQVEQEYKDRANFVMVNADKREAWPLIEAFGVDAIPHMAMISADGEVETALIGPVPKSVLAADLDTLIMNAGSSKQRPLPYTMLDTFANAPTRKVEFKD